MNQDASALEKQVALLLGNFEFLSPLIRHLDFDTDECGERINVRCSYLSFRAGEPTIDDFIDALSDSLISFCLPRKEIKVAQDGISSGDHVKAGRIINALSEKAKSLFIRAKKGSNRSGEAGEIVLYIFNEWLLKAPQIVSKMYLKTNNNMPVHGTDGIHARFDSVKKALILYWGESKAHVTLESALNSALVSIKEFVDDGKEKREIELIQTYPDFGDLDPDSVKAILNYLDPYTEEAQLRIPIFSCLLIFNYALPPSEHSDTEMEDIFVKNVKAEVAKFIAKIRTDIDSKGLDRKRFEFFLLPVTSVQAFRDKFQSKIGWPL
jgi:hypothetical protein